MSMMGLREGMEGAERELHADGDSDSSDGEGEDGDRKRERLDLLELPEGAEPAPGVEPDVESKSEAREPVVEPKPEAGASGEAEARASAAAEARAPAEVDPMDAPGDVAMISPDLQRKAEAELQRRPTENRRKALCEAAAILRAAGDTVEAQALENRAHAIFKAQSAAGHATRLFLTARSIQRAEHERCEQEAAAREDARIKELDKAFRLAKEETAGKRAAAGEAIAAARVKKLEVEALRKNAKEHIELRKANQVYMQQHLAAYLVARALEFLQDPTHGADRAAAARSLVNDYRKSKGWQPVNRAVVDPAWDATVRIGYIVTTPAVGLEKGKSKAQKEWASERMARAIYGGRDPREAKTAKATWSRLNELISEIAPGYDHRMFKGCHLGNDLLLRYGRNVDLCIIAALQRYCFVVPETEYPCVIRNWPWDAEQMHSWVTAHKASSEESSARAKLAFKASTKKSLAGAKPKAGAAPAARAAELAMPDLATPGKRLRTLGSVSSSSAPSGSASSTAAPDGFLFSKWAEAP